MKIYNVLIPLAFSIVALISESMGGECLDSDTSYVNCLLKNNDGYCYMCLTYWNTATNRWAGPIAAETIESFRKYPLRNEIGIICKKYMDLGSAKKPVDSEMLFAFANLAAHYGFKQIGNYDIYSILVLRAENISLQNLAILGDDRAIPLIKDKYVRFRVHKLSKANREVLISYLNCLYHLPEPLASQTARGLLSTETDPILKTRINLILNKKK